MGSNSSKPFVSSSGVGNGTSRDDVTMDLLLQTLAGLPPANVKSQRSELRQLEKEMDEQFSLCEKLRGRILENTFRLVLGPYDSALALRRMKEFQAASRFRQTWARPVTDVLEKYDHCVKLLSASSASAPSSSSSSSSSSRKDALLVQQQTPSSSPPLQPQPQPALTSSLKEHHTPGEACEATEAVQLPGDGSCNPAANVVAAFCDVLVQMVTSCSAMLRQHTSDLACDVVAVLVESVPERANPPPVPPSGNATDREDSSVDEDAPRNAHPSLSRRNSVEIAIDMFHESIEPSKKRCFSSGTGTVLEKLDTQGLNHALRCLRMAVYEYFAHLRHVLEVLCATCSFSVDSVHVDTLPAAATGGAAPPRQAALASLSKQFSSLLESHLAEHVLRPIDSVAIMIQKIEHVRTLFQSELANFGRHYSHVRYLRERYCRSLSKEVALIRALRVPKRSVSFLLGLKAGLAELLQLPSLQERLAACTDVDATKAILDLIDPLETKFATTMKFLRTPPTLADSSVVCLVRQTMDYFFEKYRMWKECMLWILAYAEKVAAFERNAVSVRAALGSFLSRHADLLKDSAQTMAATSASMGQLTDATQSSADPALKDVDLASFHSSSSLPLMSVVDHLHKFFSSLTARMDTMDLIKAEQQALADLAGEAAEMQHRRTECMSIMDGALKMMPQLVLDLDRVVSAYTSAAEAFLHLRRVYDGDVVCLYKKMSQKRPNESLAGLKVVEAEASLKIQEAMKELPSLGRDAKSSTVAAVVDSKQTHGTKYQKILFILSEIQVRQAKTRMKRDDYYSTSADFFDGIRAILVRKQQQDDVLDGEWEGMMSTVVRSQLANGWKAVAPTAAAEANRALSS